MKAYLDTNILFSLVKKQIENRIVGIQPREIFNNYKIEPVISSFTLLELGKVLKRELGFCWEVVFKLLEGLLEKTKVLEEVKIDRFSFKFLQCGLSLEDLLHLIFSQNNEIPIVTNDKHMINVAKNFGIRVLPLKELKIFTIENKII